MFFKKLAKERGITTLYKGICSNIIYNIAFRGLYFGLYEFGKFYALKNPYQPEVIQRSILALGTSFVAM